MIHRKPSLDSQTFEFYCLNILSASLIPPVEHKRHTNLLLAAPNQYVCFFCLLFKCCANDIIKVSVSLKIIAKYQNCHF